MIRECENCLGLAATQAGVVGVCPPEAGRVEDSLHDHIAVTQRATLFGEDHDEL